MINLLPPKAKKELRAGRANRLLLRYLLLLAGFAIILLMVTGFVYLYLQSIANAEKQKMADIESSSQELLARESDIQQFQSNLATAKQILSKQTNYSAVLLRVAQVIPSGVTLNSLTLDRTLAGTPVKLEVQATSETRLQAFKNALNESEYFDQAYYDNVVRQEGEYQYSTTLTVTFKQELFNE